MRTSRLAAHKAKLLLLHSSPGATHQANNISAGAHQDFDARPEMLCFRGQTLALVRHFFELSSQVGRVSSLLGREFFRAKVSHHAIPSFEEQAIFVRDVEICLSRLSEAHAEVITLVGLYDFSHEEAAEILHCSKSCVHGWFSEALDFLSEIFLLTGLLREDRPDRRQRQKMNDGALPLPDVAGSRRKPPGSVRSVASGNSAKRVAGSTAFDVEFRLA